ncbi:Dabb family protein [Phreatobacter aquaticus]|uniref:Dabb family protein n=1 Tax=Phreatobacter aquaticus TaxID=2570229 RepID=A0A4D7QMK2_9HYPH|nr:Dabb family protein [Phreatobacter aquaticus]QCK86317.1 Dabb family protein [Phreatobacter aquaticus]
MFHHIVLMSFTPGTGPDFFAKAQHYVERVKAECADVIGYFLADNIAARSDGLTHGIVGVFTSSAAHDAYQVSPVHQEMKAFMATRMDRIVVLDTDQGA